MDRSSSSGRPASAEADNVRSILTSLSDVREASLRMALAAQRQLCIYTQDLESTVYGEEAFIEAIKRLVLARSYAKVRVLLADATRAVMDGNRFLLLARRLTSCIDLRLINSASPEGAGAFMIADDRATLYRLQAHGWEGICDMNNPSVTRRYMNFFEEAWAQSSTDQQLRTLRM